MKIEKSLKWVARATQQPLVTTFFFLENGVARKYERNEVGANWHRKLWMGNIVDENEPPVMMEQYN